MTLPQRSCLGKFGGNGDGFGGKKDGWWGVVVTDAEDGDVCVCV